jgi:hypothetical protein
MAKRSKKSPKAPTVVAQDTLSLTEMRAYLHKSISSLNANKLNGMRAEVSLRSYLETLGFGSRVSAGGWISRSEARGGQAFAANTSVFFPETILPDKQYPAGRPTPQPPPGLYTVAGAFHSIGIQAYFCTATIAGLSGGLPVLSWQAQRLGLPTPPPPVSFPNGIQGFTKRNKRYNYLRYKADASQVSDASVPEEFSKEALRVSFAQEWLAETSDVDGLFWGTSRTYPLEIKEKTAAFADNLGHYFGLDVGPFVKLAYFASKRGNMHSMFIVREIDNVTDRSLVGWWYITFEDLAQYASWVFVGGGTSMGGGASATVRIPKSRFKPLDATTLGTL